MQCGRTVTSLLLFYSAHQQTYWATVAAGLHWMGMPRTGKGTATGRSTFLSYFLTISQFAPLVRCLVDRRGRRAAEISAQILDFTCKSYTQWTGLSQSDKGIETTTEIQYPPPKSRPG